MLAQHGFSGAAQLQGAGKEFINELFTFVPTAENVDYYINIVLDKYFLRQLKLLGDGLPGKCADLQASTEELLAEAQGKLTEITKIAALGKEPMPFRDRMLDALESIEERSINPPESIVTFGLPKLDSLLLPVEKGSLLGGEVNN